MVEEEGAQQPEHKKYQSRSFGMLVRFFEPQQQIFFDALHDQERPKKKVSTIAPLLNFFCFGDADGRRRRRRHVSSNEQVWLPRGQTDKTLLHVSCSTFILLLSPPTSCSSKWHEVVFILSQFSSRFQQLVTVCIPHPACVAAA
jgi:hypothetical protein